MTDALLILVYMALTITLLLTAWSALRSVRLRDPSQRVQNNIPATHIAWASAALLVVSLTSGFLFGSSQPVQINGTLFNKVFWLKAADMFIYAAMAEVTVATLVIGIGLGSHYRRKM